MSKIDLVSSHVETLLEQLLQTDHVQRCDDGGWTFCFGHSTTCRVRVLDRHDPRVEVYAVAAEEMRPTKALLARLNDLNAEARRSRWFAADGMVVVTHEMVGETLEYEEFVATCREVATGAEGFATSESKAPIRAESNGASSRGSAVRRGEVVGAYL